MVAAVARPAGFGLDWGMTSSEDLPSLASLIDLSGRCAVVTGAAMGIGLGIARRLHEAGASVVVADVDEAAASEAAAEMNRQRPDSAAAVGCDVSSAEDVAAVFAAADERFGGASIVVNNAGIFPMAPLADLDEQLFRHVIDVNLVGLFLCTRAAADAMLGAGGGTIVNVTSIDALHPSMVGLAHYDASKHGAWGFTKNIALELAPHGIRVNAVAPGGVLTPGVGDVSANLDAFEAAIPMGRMGVPDDIACAVLFLVSDLASYVTGSQLVVDGGRLLA